MPSHPLLSSLPGPSQPQRVLVRGKMSFFHFVSTPRWPGNPLLSYRLPTSEPALSSCAFAASAGQLFIISGCAASRRAAGYDGNGRHQMESATAIQKPTGKGRTIRTRCLRSQAECVVLVHGDRRGKGARSSPIHGCAFPPRHVQKVPSRDHHVKSRVTGSLKGFRGPLVPYYSSLFPRV